MNPHRTRLFVTLGIGGMLALVARLTTACATCVRGESRCDGKTQLVCEYACDVCDLDWRATPCTGQCVSDDGANAFCTMSDGPDPRCAGRTAYCAADMKMSCRSSYRVAEERCVSPIPGGIAECLESPHGLACYASGSIPPPEGGTGDGGVDAPGD